MNLILGIRIMAAMLLAAGAAVDVAPGRPAERVVPREETEWCNIWVAHADKHDLPRVLLIGDSIAVGYFPEVEKRLAGRVYVARLATSRCVGDPVLWAEVSLVLGASKFAVIHFNNGLHGIPGVSEREYGKSLPELVAQLRRLAPEAKLVWASSTPRRVKGEPTSFDPRNENVRERNRLAAALMAAEGIPINDLYALGAAHPEYFRDAVHYNATGRAAQGMQVAEAIARWLPAPAATPPARPLNLGAMIQPLEEANIFRLPDFYCWCPHLIKGDGAEYYLVYSRWPKSSGKGGWLTQSEVALAVGASPTGPFRHLQILLRGRGPGHWDELMAHNPKLYRFGNRYYLYYISSRAGSSHGHVRDSQRTGVAVADAITGPYRPLAQPIVEPAAPVFNITVNPAVAPLDDGRFVMMLKGDRKPKLPAERMGQRVQGIAVAEQPEGPFRVQAELAIADIDTEDAALWYDDSRRSFFAVFHAHKYIGLIESRDGFRWQRAAHYQVTNGNVLAKADGTMLATRAPLQRPGIFIENGAPRVLTLAVPEDDDWYCIAVPLQPAR